MDIVSRNCVQDGRSQQLAMREYIHDAEFVDDTGDNAQTRTHTVSPTTTLSRPLSGAFWQSQHTRWGCSVLYPAHMPGGESNTGSRIIISDNVLIKWFI